MQKSMSAMLKLENIKKQEWTVTQAIGVCILSFGFYFTDGKTFCTIKK